MNAKGRYAVEKGGVTALKVAFKDSEESRVSCHLEVIADFGECHFSALEWAEMGLELFISVIVMEVGRNCFVEDFGDEG